MEKTKDMSFDEPDAKYITGLMKKTEKNNSLADYISNVYYLFLKNIDQIEAGPVK